jgi:hypothetical protein
VPECHTRELLNLFFLDFPKLSRWRVCGGTLNFEL